MATPTCYRCNLAITDATQVRRQSRGARHASEVQCEMARQSARRATVPATTSAPAPAAVAARPAANRPSLGYDRRALARGEGFYGDSQRQYTSEVYGGDEG